jgi:hypothetical protein
VVKVDVVCQVPGKLTLRAWPSRTRLAAKRFRCDDGSALVRLKLSWRDLRKLRRSGSEAKLILTGGGERHRYTVTFPGRRSARAAAYQYWVGAEAYCGILTPTGFKYRLTAPPIRASVPGGGPDVGWVRYYWYRFGVGWVADSGWGEPFNIPDEPSGAVFLGAGWEYLLKVDSNAWYAGAIAIRWRNAGVGDWNWVPTFPLNAFNPVLHNTWCATDP